MERFKLGERVFWRTTEQFEVGKSRPSWGTGIIVGFCGGGYDGQRLVSVDREGFRDVQPWVFPKDMLFKAHELGEGKHDEPEFDRDVLELPEKDSKKRKARQRATGKKGKIEWVSYDGDYPNLCTGQLTLKINGKEVTFGYDHTKNDYPSFWSSGGHWWIDDDCIDCMEEGDWKFNWEPEHEWLSDEEKAEIETLFQNNVPNGCCGGCI